MNEKGVQVSAVGRLKCVCSGIRVRAWREGEGLWDERSENGLEEVACGERGKLGGGGRGREGVGVGWVGAAGL